MSFRILLLAFFFLCSACGVKSAPKVPTDKNFPDYLQQYLDEGQPVSEKEKKESQESQKK